MGAKLLRSNIRQLRKVFTQRLTLIDTKPKFDDWDATDREQLNIYLTDRVVWLAVIPTRLDVDKISATWLVAQGLAIPEKFWTESVDYRLWVFANAWRQEIINDIPTFILSPREQAERALSPTHPEGLAGFRVVKLCARSQKDAVLGSVRRAFLEMMSSTGSMSGTDTDNALAHGASLPIGNNMTAASKDAIDKAVLFIGTQCNWVKNPAFVWPDYITQPSLTVKGPTRYLDTIWYDHNSVSSFVKESMSLWWEKRVSNSESSESTQAPANVDKEKLLNVVNGHIGTLLFGWSLIHAACLCDLPGITPKGSMGDFGSLQRSIDTHLGSGRLADTLWQAESTEGLGAFCEPEEENPMWYVRKVCGRLIRARMRIVVDGNQALAYLFPKTWRGEVTGAALEQEILHLSFVSHYTPEAVVAMRVAATFAIQNGLDTSFIIPNALVDQRVRKQLPLLYERKT